MALKLKTVVKFKYWGRKAHSNKLEFLNIILFSTYKTMYGTEDFIKNTRKVYSIMTVIICLQTVKLWHESGVGEE